MITEFLRHMLIAAPKEVKTLGYVREAIAIEARLRRCRRAWNSHLKKCRQIIISAAEKLPPTARVTILGSGALNDVPMENLLAKGLHVTLVDIVHLPKVRKAYGGHPQVRLIERDVTGLVRPLYEKISPGLSDIMAAPPDLGAADLVISLNILSQLPINLMRYAEKAQLSLADDFGPAVMRAHLNHLNSLLASPAARSLVICDVMRNYHSGSGVMDQERVLPDALLRILPDPVAFWDWVVAPKGEIHPAISLVHQVACFMGHRRPSPQENTHPA